MANVTGGWIRKFVVCRAGSQKEKIRSVLEPMSKGQSFLSTGSKERKVMSRLEPQWHELFGICEIMESLIRFWKGLLD